MVEASGLPKPALLGERRMLRIDLHSLPSLDTLARETPAAPGPFVTGHLVPAGGHDFLPREVATLKRS